MGSTNDFFDRKREWSKLKDMILAEYLVPYLTKIAHTRRPIVIFDCFAGKGRFDDGEQGSPLIIEHVVKQYLNKNPNINISCNFIEKKYGEELQKNISYSKTEVCKDSFEDNVQNICKKIINGNAFVYVDPYGIKSLEFSSFKKISECSYNSLEMLINLNTFGFLREGCRLLQLDAEKLFSDIDDEYVFVSDVDSIEKMNEIANGDYWQKIIIDFKSEKINMFQAEELFAKLYVERLSGLFKYISHIPIKLKSKNMPKYRLIFGTNYEEGLFLMVNEMNKIWMEILLNERNMQMVLFEYVKPDSSLEYADFSKDLIAEIKKYQGFVNVRQVVVNLICKYGIAFNTKQYRDYLKKMEGDKIVEIKRTPNKTITGKKATSLGFEGKDYRIEVRINETNHT
jgi:three-Cys-motif partner protein